MKLNRNLTVLVCCAAMSLSMHAAPELSEVWVADLGNGKYQNPIIYADYYYIEALARLKKLETNGTALASL